MNSIVVKDVPKDIINKYWNEISYKIFIKQISKKNNIDYWTDTEIENMGTFTFSNILKNKKTNK